MPKVLVSLSEVSCLIDLDFCFKKNMEGCVTYLSIFIVILEN